MSTWKTVAPPEFFHSPVSGTLSISSITLTARIAEAENSIMIYRVTKSDI